MTLSPSQLSANFQTGTSATLTVRATVTDPSIFDSLVFVYVVDSQQVLTGGIELAQVDERTFSTTLHTSASIPSGHYTGSFQIQLCRDVNCTSQFPGSPASLPYDFTVTAAPLRASASSSTAATVHWGATVSQTVPVSVTGPDLPWTATANAPWLKVNGGSGTTPGAFTVGYDATGLAEAEYASTVTVRSSDGQTAEVPFSLTVLPTHFAVVGGVPSFAAINGAPISAQQLAFELDSLVASPWTATSSAAWLLASPLSGTTPGSITLQPDPSRGPLASGTHEANVVLSSPGVVTRTVTAGLSLTRASLSSATDAITLGGPKGRDLTSSATLNVSLNTGSNAWPFSLSSLPAWLSSSTTAGTVAAAGTSLSFTPNAAGATPGSVSSTVTVTATVNGDTVTRPVTVNLNADQRRILVSEWGVALASTPTGSVLTRTVTVTDNFRGNTLGEWSPVSDSAWLTATGSGGAGQPKQVTLVANPASLPAGAVSYANVTVSAPGAEPAVIRVALYKSATGLASTVTLPQDYAELIADKIRPHVYAHRGGTSIDVYNAYTAQKIATLNGVGSALGKMAVSPDGSKLFVLDTAVRSLRVVDLATNAVTSWPLANGVSAGTTLLAIRPNGVEIVLVGDGTAYTAGRSLGTTNIRESMAASSDGRKVYTQNQGISPASILAYDVDYSAMAGGVLIVAQTAEGWFVNGSSNGRDIAVSGDASRLYTASGAPYRCTAVDPASLTFVGSLPGGDSYPNNVEVTRDGRVICGISGWYSSADFWVHSSTGVLLGSYKIAGYAREMKAAQMVVTPDGLVVVALTDDPAMAFVPIGP